MLSAAAIDAMFTLTPRTVPGLDFVQGVAGVLLLLRSRPRHALNSPPVGGRGFGGSGPFVL